MAFNRRNFLKAGLSGAAMAIGGTAFAACAGKPASTEASPAAKLAGIPYQSAAQLNLSLQEGVAPGNSLNEKLDFMEKNGVVGLEPGGGDLAKRVNELKQALNGRNIKISAICAGFKGFILSTDAKVRQECMDTMKEILAAAGELGSVGVIIVPAFNGQKPCMPHTQETRDFLCERFNELGNFAHEIVRRLSICVRWQMQLRFVVISIIRVSVAWVTSGTCRGKRLQIWVLSFRPANICSMSMWLV